MSLMRLTCPWCGKRYMFGIVGRTMLGGHACRVDPPPCEYEGCDAPGVVWANSTRMIGAGTKEDPFVNALNEPSFRCWDHLDGLAVVMVQ